jgi:hypothetical protein
MRLIRYFGDGKVFVKTSNCDLLHVKVGGNAEEIHGSLRYVQCAAECSQTLWPLNGAYKARLEAESDSSTQSQRWRHIELLRVGSNVRVQSMSEHVEARCLARTLLQTDINGKLMRWRRRSHTLLPSAEKNVRTSKCVNRGWQAAHPHVVVCTWADFCSRLVALYRGISSE